MENVNIKSEEIENCNPLDSVRSKDHFVVTELSTAKPKFILKLQEKLRRNR